MDIYEKQDKLIRRLKLLDYFMDAEGTKDDESHDFTNPSSWTPPDHKISDTTLRTVNNIVTATDTYIKRHRITERRHVVHRNFRDNLAPAERRAIAELRNNHDIVIKPADKGSATVVVNRSAYVTEVYRQLNNPRYYKRLTQPIYPDNVDSINTVLEEMHDDGYITAKQLLHLRAQPTDGPRKFYVLPKIHKPRQRWPQPDRMPEGRPIVSDTGSESYRVSKFIDHHIRPLSTDHPSYVKDTYDFVAKIRLQQVPKDAFLVTGDVTALYTNMDIQRTLEVTRDALRQHPDANRPDDYILRLLDITLNNNDFEFNGEYFLQICGTAMGKSYAPGLADLYMEKFDKKATAGNVVNQHLYHRFLDDIFFVWTGSEQQLIEYQTFINGIIPGITVTLNWSRDRVDFLDTTIYKQYGSEYDVLLTKVHFKPTDTHQLLHRGSFHPRHTTKGILKSQLIRFRRIASCRADYDEACNALFSALGPRGYSQRHMRQMKAAVWKLPTVNRRRNADSDEDILPIVVPFNDVGTGLACLWRNIIEDNGLFSQVRLINAYTVGRNLARTLVSSKLRPITNSCSSTDIRKPANLPNGCFRCTSNHCRVCNYITAGTTFRSSHNNRSYSVEGHITCKTSNIIYLVTCRNCQQQYVGQTSRTLADRANDHLSYIRTRKTSKPTGLHFNQTGHTIQDFTIMGIEQLSTSSDLLPIAERKWQQLLQTNYPNGINQIHEHLLNRQPTAAGRASALS
jgi:hypothetical protein